MLKEVDSEIMVLNSIRLTLNLTLTPNDNVTNETHIVLEI